MGWIFKNVVLSFVSNLVNGLLDLFGNVITFIFEIIADINLSNSIVVNANKFTTIFAIAMVCFVATKTYFSTYVLETEGDPDSNPIDILTRAAQATAVISCGGWIANMFLTFSKLFTVDLVGSAEVEVTTTLSGLLSTAVSLGTLSAGIFILLLLIMVLALIIFVIQAGIRGAELSLMKILFPLFATDLVGLQRERWNSFFTHYVITYLGYSIQLLSFRCFSISLASMAVDTLGVQAIVAFGWLVLMLRAPKWLEKFCYTSGVGKSMASGARTAGHMLMFTRR